MHVVDDIERVVAPSVEELYRRWIRPKRPVVLLGIHDEGAVAALGTAHRVRHLLGAMRAHLKDEYTTAFHPLSQATAAKETSLAAVLAAVDNGDHRYMCSEEPTPPELRRLVANPYLDAVDSGDVESSIFVGGSGAYAHLHFDTDGRDVLLTQLFGEKRVVVAPYRQHPEIILSGLNGYPNFSQRCLEHYTAAERHALLNSLGARETVLRAGETILIPSLCWHSVGYLGPAMSFNVRMGRSAPVRRLMNMLPVAWPLQVSLVCDIAWELSQLSVVPEDVSIMLDDVASQYMAVLDCDEHVADFVASLQRVAKRLSTSTAYGTRDYVVAKKPRHRALSGRGVRLARPHRVLMRLAGGDELPAELTVIAGTRVVGRVARDKRVSIGILELLSADATFSVDELADRLACERVDLFRALHELAAVGWIEPAKGASSGGGSLPQSPRKAQLSDVVRPCLRYRWLRSMSDSTVTWLAIEGSMIVEEITLTPSCEPSHEAVDRLLRYLCGHPVTAARVEDLVVEANGDARVVLEFITMLEQRGFATVRSRWEACTIVRARHSTEILRWLGEAAAESVIVRDGHVVAVLATDEGAADLLTRALSMLAGPARTECTVEELAASLSCSVDDAIELAEELEAVEVVEQGPR